MTSTFLGLPRAVDTQHLHGDRTFPEAARVALADTQLRRNLGKATATIRDKRARVVGEVPDWAQLRAAGAAIKDKTLAQLDQYLVQLAEQVTARGGTVHWARDAAEANRIVTDLVRATGADEVVKVKSMATQEIGLNEALAGAGIAAWETDLAELIVQLGHDTPSHILVPAIHRNRAEIRDIFVREMGSVGLAAPDGLTDEPRALAEAARRHLRRKFLGARAAVSGANFAVAETGTLAVVESEGNGRMCLTLPRTLITVMGIEKLVPTWADLEVFLQLLPRSSTGERMNPYTSMWTGVSPGDGPQDFHLVLLDNGRTGVLGDPDGRTALRCIRCSACLNVCPVYERTGGHAYGSVYPGPIGAVLSPQLTGLSDPASASLPYASSLCGACYDVCPVAIDIPSMLVHLRGQVVEAKRAAHRTPTPEQAVMTAAAWTMASPRRWAAALRAARLGRLLGRRRGRISTLPPPLSGWTASRDLPLPPPETFRDWWTRTRGRAVTTSAGRPSRDPAAGKTRATAGGAGAAALDAGSGAARDTGSGAAAGAAPASAWNERGGASRDAGAGVPRDAAPASAREEVLGRIRRALGDHAAPVRVPRDYRHAGDLDRAALLDLLTDRLVDYGAAVRRTGDAEAALVAALADRGAARVVMPAGLPWSLPGAVVDDGLTAAELDALDGVVTACAVAVAETGTIVLDASPDQGRRAITLVPDYHLCVVRADQVVQAVPEAIARLDPVRPLTWISGPSATSDIELHRVEGVHGPRTLEVVLVEGLR